MTIDVTTLANGLRVVSHHMPHLETLSLGVWIGAGARHEAETQQGISHLLEHMAFKGTARRSARQIAEDIEQVGGELNAATSLETTAYYARVLKGDEGIALEILADILLNATYSEEELEREREVILQEIAGINDSPDELGYDLVNEAAFPGQPVGRPIIGTPQTVKRIGADELRAFLGRHYVGPRTVISAAGAIDHDRLVRLAEAQFGGMSAAQAPAGEGARYGGGRRASAKPFEQSHVLLGFSSPSYRDEQFYAAQVFSGLMGGGMSSRLFQEVRESRGLAYAIYSTAWGLADAGLFMVHAATGADTTSMLIDVVAGELARAVNEDPSEAEVHRAKAQIKVALSSSLESTGARAEQMARQLLLANRLVPTAELIERVNRVSPGDVRAVAGRILAGAKPSVAVVGAGRRSQDYAAAAELALTG